jgi:predicted dehydrogenase
VPVNQHRIQPWFRPGKATESRYSDIDEARKRKGHLLGIEGAIELPHDAFVPWGKDAAYTVCKVDEEQGNLRTVPGADEYRLMLEHFGAAVLGDASLAFGPKESVHNMEVLDALAGSAQTGRTVPLRR